MSKTKKLNWCWSTWLMYLRYCLTTCQQLELSIIIMAPFQNMSSQLCHLINFHLVMCKSETLSSYVMEFPECDLRDMYYNLIGWFLTCTTCYCLMLLFQCVLYSSYIFNRWTVESKREWSSWRSRSKQANFRTFSMHYLGNRYLIFPENWFHNSQFFVSSDMSLKGVNW